MEFNRLAFGAIAAACITAAGGGAYLATRHNAAQEPAPAAAAAPADLPSSSTAGTEVSEGVVIPPPAAAEAGRPAAAAAPVPTAETPRAPRPALQARPARPFPEGRRSNFPARNAGAEPRATEPEPGRTQVPDRSASQAQPPEPVTTEASAPIYAPPPAPPSAPEPQLQELAVSADQVIGLQIDTPLVTTERARVEDRVDARVTRDVKVADRVAIPAGAKALGSVTLVDRGGKMRDRARLGVRFHTIVLADGTRLPIQTDAVFREGDAPGGESAAKIGGGAIGGAIIGGILGGARGAILGGTAGAGAGTAAVMAGGRNAATLHAGETVTVRLMQPVTVTVEKD